MEGFGNGDLSELPMLDIQDSSLPPHEKGRLIGHTFAKLIKARVSGDTILNNDLLPFAMSETGSSLLSALSNTNRNMYPMYWDELRGTADGSGVPLLNLLLLNFRKEVAPFLPKKVTEIDLGKPEECSDVLVVDKSCAFVGHNEDANISVRGYVYLVRVSLKQGGSFTAYTYAGELPSCAFGFNSHGFAFTLNSVPPTNEEIEMGGVGRNFISRDLLEAVSIDDGLKRIHLPNISVGHSYNLIDTRNRKVCNVETASRNRISILEIGSAPFFHANMYLHLDLIQMHDESSVSRKKRADELLKSPQIDFLSILGDYSNTTYPIYMQGPSLCTLCTVIIDLDQKILSIYHGNPKLKKIVLSFPL